MNTTNQETQSNPDYQNVLLSRRAAEMRGLRWKFNVFQLAKRVRRATRNGKAALAVLALHKGKAAVSRHSANRTNLAHYLLHRSEQTLRVAKYYCADFNVPMTDNSFDLNHAVRTA